MTKSNAPQSYDWSQSYQWNYDHAPAQEPSPVDLEVEPEGKFDFFDHKVASPLGIAAGPLLNGRWVLHYAQLGFSTLTYKTVRSRARACYPLPNLLPVEVRDVVPGEELQPAKDMQENWAISFGMPSAAPEIWTQDVAWTRQNLPKNRALSVSVVATPDPDWTLEQVAEDYARCAQLAAQSGANCIEANFSCPNVQSADGQLFQTPQSAALVSQKIRDAIGDVPLIIKIGYMDCEMAIASLVEALAGTIDGFSMTNCIAATVHSPAGQYFDGQPRGIGGQAIRRRSIEQVARFAAAIQDTRIRLVGVGGVFTEQHVRQYMDAGAHAVHVATAAILNPELAIQTQSAF